jgi:hypothetical protein
LAPRSDRLEEPRKPVQPRLATLQKCPSSHAAKSLEIPVAQRLSGLQGLAEESRVELPVKCAIYPQMDPAKAQFP